MAASTSFVLSPRNSCLISRFSHLKPRLASSNTPKYLMLSTTNDKRTGSSKLLPVICSAVKDIDGKAFCSTETVTYPGGATKSHSPRTAEEKIGVLLLNHGGPATIQEVQPFLFNLFADPDIVRLPRWFEFLQRPLAQLISVLRAPKSKEGYAAIGGGSPLLKITDEQANALKAALEAKEVPANVYVAMRYWHPSIEEAVHQIKRDKITRLVVLPLYPQNSISTAQSSIRVLQEKFRDDLYFSRLPVAITHSWYQRKGYIKAMADLIEKELQTFPTPEETMIFFSANGVPLSYVENAGDPYRYQMENCISLIMEELKSRGTLNDHILAYQSRVGQAQWLKPYADEALVELGQRGVKSLLVVPVSFVSECSKTVHGIDVELKELALKSGIVNWGRVPALNCTETFIDVLAKATIKALPRAMPIGGNNPRCHRAVLFCSIGLVTSLALLFCSNELVISLNDHLLPEIIISWISTGSSFLVLRLKSVSKTYLTGLIDGLIKMGLIFLTGKAILALKHFVPEDLMRKVKLALKDHLPPED